MSKLPCFFFVCLFVFFLNPIARAWRNGKKITQWKKVSFPGARVDCLYISRMFKKIKPMAKDENGQNRKHCENGQRCW